MGNKASSIDAVTSAVDENSQNIDVDGKPSSSFSFTGTPKSSGKKGRRIIKATQPKPLEGGGDEKKDVDDDDDDDNNKHHHHNDKNFGVLESPSIAREIQQEESEKRKLERFGKTAERRKTLQEKKLEERRKQMTQKQLGSSDSNGSATTTNTEASPAANPMSRFLSVFSVEPKYPEHKRKVSDGGDTDNDDDDTDRPSEKRLKIDESNVTGKSLSDDGTMGGIIRQPSRMVILVSVVAAAAAVTLMIARKKR